MAQAHNISSTDQLILVINPGSTSTQVALYRGDAPMLEEEIHHASADLPSDVVDQLPIRWKALKSMHQNLPKSGLAAVAARGGPLKPLAGGTYLINDTMLDDLRSGAYSNHASNLGALLAHRVMEEFNIPGYIVDPITTDEFYPEARVSGVPGIERKSRSHALNIKAVSRKTAADLGRPLGECRFIVAHMGGGISVAAVEGGSIVDVNDALLGMGPFSPERAGALPLDAILKMAFSGEQTYESLVNLFSRESGLKGYLGTRNLEAVEARLSQDDHEAALIYQAMIYQIAKEIGAMATVLEGLVDQIVLTGGLAHSILLTARIQDRVRFIAPVTIIPGSLEMAALAAGVLRVLNGEEEVQVYV